MSLLQELCLAVTLFAIVADLTPAIVVALNLGHMLTLVCRTQILRVGAGLGTESDALGKPGLTVLGSGVALRSSLL